MANINKIKLSGVTYNIEDLYATKSVELTQAQYDVLVSGGTVDPNTFYIITDAQSVDISQYYTSAQTQSAITQAVSGKQDTLSAGTGIQISGNVISGVIDLSLDSGSTNAIANSAATIAIYDRSKKEDTLKSYSFGTTDDKYFIRFIKGDNTYTNPSYIGKINGNLVWGTSDIDSCKNWELVETSAITSAVTSASTDSEIPSAKAVYDALEAGGGGGGGSSYSAGTGIDITNDVISVSGVVMSSAITSAVTSASTDSEVPSAKAVFDVIAENEQVTSAALNDLNSRKADSTALNGKLDTSTFNTYSGAVDTALSGKQDTLSAGTNITISGNVISASGGASYSAGRNIDIYGEYIDCTIPISGGGNDNNSVIENNYYNSAEGSYAHSEGYYTNASGDYAHAEGNSTTAEGEASHSEGSGSDAYGSYAHAEGEGTYAYGQSSHAEGRNTAARNYCAHAEGEGTYAEGYASHSEGSSSEANGSYAHAEGESTTASGNCSHTEGYNTIAYNEAEHASGQYNVSSSASTSFGHSGNTLFSVGNGDYQSRHNAFEIRQNGDIYVSSGGTDIKLQDNLGGGAASSAVTSGDTNAVAGGAVYDKLAEIEQVTAASLNDLNDKFGGLRLVKLTQSAYDSLSPNYDSNTLYVIV